MITYYFIKYIKLNNYLIEEKISKLVYNNYFNVEKILCYFCITVNNH